MEHVENYLHCVKAANIALQLCERIGAVPGFLENEITFLQGLTSPKTRIAVPSEDFVRRVFETEAEPTREMRLPYPVVYLNYAIPIIGRGPSRRKTNLTYHGLLLFEVPQDYMKDGEILLPFMRDLAPEAFAGLDDEYGRGDIRIMGYNSEGDTPPTLTRLWLHREPHRDPKEPGLPVDDYEVEQLRRFVAGYQTLMGKSNPDEVDR